MSNRSFDKLIKIRQPELTVTTRLYNMLYNKDVVNPKDHPFK